MADVQREKQERIKQLAAEVREENLRKHQVASQAASAHQAVAALAARREREKEPTGREKALAFAKNVPKPEPPKQKPAAPGAFGGPGEHLGEAG